MFIAPGLLHVNHCALPQFEAAYPDDQRPRKAIEAARRWVRKPSAGYAAAANAAYAATYAYAAANAADNAAYAATYAADNAANAAASAASTAREAERKWQVKRLRQYLDGKVAP